MAGERVGLLEARTERVLNSACGFNGQDHFAPGVVQFEVAESICGVA